MSMPDPHVWDRENNEMELVTLGPGSTVNVHFELAITVAINAIDVIDGKPVLQIIHSMGNTVVRIIDTIEFEARRRGYLV
jgi:hypothetical protein